MEQVKLKYLCSSYSTPLTQDQIQGEGQYTVYGASGPAGRLAEPGCETDYLGIIKDGAGVGRVNIYEAGSYLLGTMAYIVPNAGVDINWLKYAVMSLNLSESISKTTIPHIYFSEYGNRKVGWCSIETQTRIAMFLDSKCTEIDSVIADTKRTIEEYKSLRLSVIADAVTRGVCSKRPMKDSGIKWVKQLPVEWNPINPKALFTQRKDKAAPGERQLTASQQHGVIYQDEYMALTGSKVVTVEKDFDILKHVEAGDFVISMRSFQGGLEYSANTGSISSAYVMLIPNLEMVEPRFFRWLFKSSVYINALQSTSNLVRDGQAMRYSNFAQVRLYTVPIDEQREVADYLDQKCTEIDALIAKKEQFLVEMENYKKTLIYEYVTGKKEVPACQ